MSEFPRPQLVTSAVLPSQVFLPDIPAYTSKVFTLKLNPHHLQAAHESYQWFDSFVIHSGSKRKRFFDYDFGLMSALCCSDADFAHLRIAMDVVLWLLAFDDMIDRGALNSVQEMKYAVDATMKVLHNPGTPPPKFKVAAVLQSCFDRMCQDGGPETLRRFVDATDIFTQRSLQQQINESTERIPNIEEYIQHRREASAMMGVLELALAGSDILNWANDIYSFPIEFARGDVHNFVAVAMEHNKLGVQEAIEYVDRRIRARLEEYVAAKSKLPWLGFGVDEQLVKYIQRIEHFVQGFIDWSFITPRYFGDDTKKVKETRVVNLVAPIALDAPERVET